MCSNVKYAVYVQLYVHLLQLSLRTNWVGVVAFASKRRLTYSLHYSILAQFMQASFTDSVSEAIVMALKPSVCFR